LKSIGIYGMTASSAAETIPCAAQVSKSEHWTNERSEEHRGEIVETDKK
jgi:hypothetical protein